MLQQYVSIEAALRAVYPHYPWDSTRFEEARELPTGKWQNPDNVMDALLRAEQQLGILKVMANTRTSTDCFSCTQPEDWYSVTVADLKELGLPTALTKIKLAELLQQRYPGYEWDRVAFLKGTLSQHKLLEKRVASLFPVRRCCMPHQTNTLRSQNDTMTVKSGKGVHTQHAGMYDIFIKHLNLAFSYWVGIPLAPMPLTVH